MSGDDKPLRGVRSLVLRRAHGAPAQSPNAVARAFADMLIALRGARHFGFGVPWHGSGRLLDFGCGAGKFLKRMSALGWDVTGIDFSEVAVASVRDAGLKAMQGSLPHAGLAGQTFDVVTMRHALEHVPDPLAVLRAAREVLAPGGKLVIQVPNFASWEVEYFQDAAELLDLPRHLSHFTPSTLRGLLGRAGFSSIDVRQACYASRLKKSARLLKPGERGPDRKLGRLFRQTWACRLACATIARNRGNELIATASP
jgi:SAM-dependent methyltransferase